MRFSFLCCSHITYKQRLDPPHPHTHADIYTLLRQQSSVWRESGIDHLTPHYRTLDCLCRKHQNLDENLEWPALRCCLQAWAHLDITWADIQHYFSISIWEMFDTQHWAKAQAFNTACTHAHTHAGTTHLSLKSLAPMPTAVSTAQSCVCVFVC